MKRTLVTILLVTAPLGLNACMVGPTYRAPEAADLVPEAWADASAESGHADLREWWLRFDDEELTSLVERAVESNLTLAEARERLVAARARRGIANADRLPTLDALGSYTRTQTGEEASIPGGLPPGVESDVYALGAVAGWELDLWGRVARLVEAADADMQFAAEDYRASRVALAAEVAREVVSIRAIDRDIALVEATTQTNQDALEIARARSQAGFGDDLDTARAQRDLESNLALLPALRADRREAEFRLAVLLGEPAGAINVSRAELPAGVDVPDRGVPADLLMRRPDLRRAERELAAATARIGAARAERFPRVTLLGSLSLQGPDIGDVVNPGAYVLQAGPSISLPIFQGGRIDARVQEAESGQRLAMIRLRAAAIDALAEVESASIRRSRAAERRERFRAAETAARDAEDLSMDRYIAGRSDFLGVTEARRTRLSIERSVVAAQRDALLGIIDLYASLGGGWAGPSADAIAQEPTTLQ